MSKLKWVLVVDDEPEIINSVRELLLLTFGEDKLKVVEAQNGLEAAVKVKNQKFDCIISDLKMPKKEGSAFVASARQHLFNADTPIIILSSYLEKQILQEFRFIYFLEKPFTHDNLAKMVSVQLKLGKGGERLAADIVNRVLGGTEKFLVNVLGDCNFKIETPQGKVNRVAVTCEYAIQLDFIDDGVHNTFSLLFNGDVLEKIMQQKNMTQSSLESVALGFGQAILEYAITDGLSSGQKYKITPVLLPRKNESLTSARGILIPISFDGMRFEVLATSKRAQKSAA